MIAAVLGGFDRSIWRFFVEHHYFISLAKAYTKWGVSTVLLPLALFTGIVIFVRYRSIALAIIPMVSLQINDVITAFSKSAFSVARPARSEWLAGAAGGSFPSGHVANTTSVVIATALLLANRHSSRNARWAVFATAGVLVTLMGWSRLALNVHWLSDVLAGWFLGSMVAVITVWGIMKLASKVAPTRRNVGS